MPCGAPLTELRRRSRTSIWAKPSASKVSSDNSNATTHEILRTAFSRSWLPKARGDSSSIWHASEVGPNERLHHYSDAQ